MYYQEKKKQIYLKNGYNDLSGKVVDKVSLYSDCCNCERGELLITFTDDTFILLAPTWNDDNDDCILENEYIQPLNEGSSKPGYISNNEFHWDSQFQRYVDCGIIEFDKNIVKGWIEEGNKKEQEREYQQYLRLKEKFEK